MVEIRQLPTSQIAPGNNDRTRFDQGALQELASSIRAHGLAQPITVRPIERCTECDGAFALHDAPEFCPSCGNDAFETVYQIVAGAWLQSHLHPEGESQGIQRPGLQRLRRLRARLHLLLRAQRRSQRPRRVLLSDH